MTAGPDGDPSSTLSPDEAFALVGDETRIDILQALWEAHEPQSEASGLSFSDLYDRVDIQNTGNFSYHLDKLAGHFVEETDTGYRLTQGGFQVVTSVIAGTMTADPQFGSTRVPASCPLCEAPVEVAYDETYLRCLCTECDGVWSREDGESLLIMFRLPPGGVENRTPEEVFRATLRYNFHKIASMRSGVCQRCSGTVEETVDVCLTHNPGERSPCPACGRAHMAEVTDVCQSCKSSVRGPVRAAVLTHPAVTAFYDDHGDEHRFATWDAFRRSHDVREELVSEDPIKLRLSIPADDEELQITVDDSVTVLEVTRARPVDRS